MGKRKKIKKTKEPGKRGRQGGFTQDQEVFLTSLISNFRSSQAARTHKATRTRTHSEFWASMYAEWSKRWPRAEVTEEEREAGVADADKAIIELKVNHY
jgi:hypothetical protein